MAMLLKTMLGTLGTAFTSVTVGPFGGWTAAVVVHYTVRSTVVTLAKVVIALVVLVPAVTLVTSVTTMVTLATGGSTPAGLRPTAPATTAAQIVAVAARTTTGTATSVDGINGGRG